jgi:hypothetical protein
MFVGVVSPPPKGGPQLGEWSDTVGESPRSRAVASPPPPFTTPATPLDTRPPFTRRHVSERARGGRWGREAGGPAGGAGVRPPH